MTTSFFLIFSEHPWDKLRANLPHLQFLAANNCEYSSHTDIKLCTYCLYRHTTVLIHEILYLANQLWSIDFLTPPTPIIIPHRLPAFLESLMPLKIWCSIHARCSKSSLKHSICSFSILSKFKTEFYFILFFWSVLTSRLYFWNSPAVIIRFSRVYSNCCCRCSFEAEIIKIGQSSQKMYSNNWIFKSLQQFQMHVQKSMETYWRHLVSVTSILNSKQINSKYLQRIGISSSTGFVECQTLKTHT